MDTRRIDRFGRTDWVAAALLFAAGLALRVPFRSQLAYHWDSAQFSLAINDYNMAISQPHAPGYFLYIMVGRLANALVGEPHASLVWVSVLVGSALAGLLYLLGTAMFGRRSGLASALFTLTSPQVWFHSCVALTYVVDAFLICLTVLCCWRAMQRGGGWGDAAVMGVLLAAVSGVRLQNVPGLIPLALYTIWKFETFRARRLLVAAAVAVAAIAPWFFYMVKVSGGLTLSLELVRRHAAFNAPATLAGGGWNALLWNVFLVGLFSWNGLMLAVVPLVGGLLYRAFRVPAERKQRWDNEHALAVRTLAIWIVPMLLLATAVGFTKQPGYVLSYLPGLLLLAAVAVAQLRKRWAFVSSTALVCAVNMLAFVAWPRAWDGLFFGAGRTAREIHQHDQQLAQTISGLRAGYRPAEAVLCHAGEYLLFGMRHFQLHAPEFDQFQLALDPTMVTPPDKPMMSVQGGRLVFVGEDDVPGDRVLLLVVPPGSQVSVFGPAFDVGRAKPLEGSGATIYILPAQR